uniref:Disks large-associated protein 5 n=1 Tax=Pyxicephalus adspersus TaxID=30357 RepID=A0AAV2ZRE8_PYXAD|nr:TPA: hypothetical protein GDO54_005357 [Pyxicephalus adspersus]
MDIKSQFAGRYKTDMSIENLRAKVARRKSITQKENRHKEYRRGRGLALVDINVSVVKEQDLTVLDEVNETFSAKGAKNKTVPGKMNENISAARRAMLQRFLEEKQLRKLKEQREKASKGIFKCGIYKPEASCIPVLTSQNVAKVKPKEKPAPPVVTRVTRSAAKVEASVPNTRSRPAKAPGLNKASDRTVPKGRGQTSVLKMNEKENKVAPKPQKRTKENSEQEVTLTKPKPVVSDETEKLMAEVATEVTAMESEVPGEKETCVQKESEVPAEKESEVPAEKETCVQKERKPSFAPDNFKFQPLDGLSTFKFQPMTPKRASAFLTPTFTWSPVDGKRQLLKSEIQKLTLLCCDWDKRIDQDIPEDAKDLIRTTVGQTRLLMTERFKQFEGLVDNCEFKLGEKETTCTDLDGFWDMVYFQIEDVSKKFVNLGKLEQNAWQQTTFQTKKVVRKKPTIAATVNKSQGDSGRAAARSRLAAIKAAMRNKVKQEELVEEVTVSERPMPVNPVVFDAGFFRIESPAKLPGSLRSTRVHSQANTPKSAKKDIQNSVTGSTEESAGQMPVKTSPMPAKSPARKALFDAEGESLQNHQEDPVVTNPENTETESETVPQVVDLSKYLVHTTTENPGSVTNSPGFMECSRLETGGTELEEDSKFDITSTVVDDVFMCSPEKVQETKISPPKDDFKNPENPLDFLESCTSSNMVEK